MELRNRIWHEMSQAKFNNHYCCYLIGMQRNLSSSFNIIILIFSSAGVMGWKIWQNIPVISCVVVSMISLIKLIQSHIIPSDKQIEKLDKIADFYFSFYHKLEKLWYELENNNSESSLILKEFHELKETERITQQLVNENIKRHNKRLAKRATKECIEFFNKSFNTKMS